MQKSDEEMWARIHSVRHWYHKIPIKPGMLTPGINDAAETLAMLDLPDDATGLRVLDVGTRDGYFAFELERRGAEVVAVDYVAADQTGFRVAADLIGSRVEHRNANIYDLTAAEYGTFDIVLFLGLLYHLPDPIQALLILRSLCRDRMAVESHVIDNGMVMEDGSFAALADVAPALARIPIMQFYPGKTLANDPTNYWGPNLACLEAMLGECGFATASRHLHGARGIVNCRVADDLSLTYHHQISRGLFAQ